jgi:O-antigen/teichoic acid export membrane protein
VRFSAALTAERLLPERLALLARPLLGRIDALVFAADERGAAGRMSLIAFAVRVASAAIAFGGQVLLARWMGSFSYGVFVLAWLAMVIAGSLSCVGFHTSVVRFVPEYRERGMLAELRGILWASRLFVLIASSALAGLAACLLWLFSGRIEPYYVAPFLFGLFCIPMIALGDTLQGLARAQSWALAALAPTYLVRPALLILFMGLGVWLDYPPSAETAVLAAILATYCTTLGQLVFLTARMDRHVPRGPHKVMLGTWLAVSLPIFLVESFFFLLTNADVLMVGVYLPPEDVAVYYATVKTLALVHFVYFAVKAGVGQRFATFAHGKSGAERARLAAFARETVSWTFWPSLLMALTVLALGRPLIGLFGEEFATGYPLLLPLLAGVVLRAAVGPAETLLTMSGHQNACAAVFALTLALNIGASALLIPLWGLWGAAAATALSILFETAALAFTVWRRFGIVMFVFGPSGREETR